MATVTFKGEEFQLAGTPLKEGDLAPNFPLTTKSLETKSLDDYRGKKKVIMTVPSFDTPVCSKQTIALNDLARAYPGVAFLVISIDSPFAADRFCSKENLSNIETLSNMRSSSNFGKDYGVLITSGPLDGAFTRSVLILDENDRVIYSDIASEITQEVDLGLVGEYLASSEENQS